MAPRRSGSALRERGNCRSAPVPRAHRPAACSAASSPPDSRPVGGRGAPPRSPRHARACSPPNNGAGGPTPKTLGFMHAIRNAKPAGDCSGEPIPPTASFPDTTHATAVWPRRPCRSRRAPRASLPARARTRPRAAGSSSRRPAPLTLPAGTRDPSRSGSGRTKATPTAPPTAAARRPSPRSPGIRPRRRRRLLGGAPAARAWRRRPQKRLEQPPRGLRGARAAGARSAPAPRAQVPARAAARAGGRRRVPAGPGPAPATPRRALLLAPAGGTAAPARPGIRGGGGCARRSAFGRLRSLRLRLGRARGGGGRSAAGAGTALSGAVGAAGAALRAAGRQGRRRRLRLPGPSR